MRKLCRECASPLTGSVSICEDHETPDGRSCSTCGTHFPVWGEIRCETCRFAKRLPVELCAMGLTPVIAFLHEREIDVFAASFGELGELIATRFQTAVTRDPLRVTITIVDGAEELTVTVDDELAVVENPG